ncbi:hypothetical protein TSUD_302800 [Trifolium subterraneum]|uniref:Uncharacterized protein n=1 Tax=Trifolium subterraneum TaxID=3900 RepID=A0A2Z6PPX8_TRISU|nr:hypothetical protein TSUD_302800 [Trifolium subterraneum]
MRNNRLISAPGGIVLSAPPRIGSLPTANNQPDMQFQFNMMTGNMIDCDFYIPDSTGDNTGLAFRVAYDAAQKVRYSNDSINNKKVCTYVGSMLCSVIPGFRNSVETALNGIGVRPCFVSLPSQAQDNNLVISSVSQFDWPSILAVFGYCILLLFKVDNNKLFRLKDNYLCNCLSIARIDELGEKVGCSSINRLNLPFDDQKEYTIRTMLRTHPLRETVITFLMNNFNHPDSQICNLCQYLSYKLSWSGDMRVFTVMYERLVKTNSPVLAYSLVTSEVDNLEETMKAIAAHTYPQYFGHLCSVSDLYFLDVLRFRSLFAVALELDRAINSSYCPFFKSEDISKADHITVRELLKLHWAAKAENPRVTTGRRMPTIRGI